MLSMKKWRLDTFEYVKVGFKLNLTIVSIEDHFLP